MLNDPESASEQFTAVYVPVNVLVLSAPVAVTSQSCELLGSKSK
jgi:hypothetical protein